MAGQRGTLFVRIAILILILCLGVLFLAASIMSQKYTEEPDASSRLLTTRANNID